MVLSVEDLLQNYYSAAPVETCVIKMTAKRNGYYQLNYK